MYKRLSRSKCNILYVYDIVHEVINHDVTPEAQWGFYELQ